jgi:predicted SprT family Zn-dependent metalloprotease
MKDNVEQHEFILQDNSPITMPKFQEVFDELMGRTWEYDGKFFNLKELNWTWGYSNKKRALGTCLWNRFTKQGRITISKTLLSINLDKNPKKFEDTIRHEIAHAIDYLIRGDSGHDYPWQKIAVHLGAIPKSGSKQIESAPFKWSGLCDNGHPHQRHKLTKNAKGAACAKCCNEHNGGKYSSEFLIHWSKNF